MILLETKSRHAKHLPVEMILLETKSRHAKHLPVEMILLETKSRHAKHLPVTGNKKVDMQSIYQLLATKK